jgi:outer membrane protein
MKLTFLTIILSFFISNSYAQQLFAHVNAEEIIAVMPEAATATMSFQEEQKILQEQKQMMMTEYESQAQEFQLNMANMTEIIKNDKLQSLRSLEERIMLFEQSIEQSLSKKYQELMIPISNKIQEAINLVAQEKGYAYVFELTAQQGGLVYTDNQYDITSLVKEKLNLK